MAKEQKLKLKDLPLLLENLKASIGGLAGRIEKLEEKFDSFTIPVVSPTILNPATPVLGSEYPIPVDYRSVVSDILNASFGVTVTPHSDSPVFTFTIVVPEKYSTMSPAQKEVMKYDLRPRVISYAEGVNGVREWALKVFENFSMEIRAQIVDDRTKLVGV